MPITIGHPPRPLQPKRRDQLRCYYVMKRQKKRPGDRSLPEMANIYQRLQKIKPANNRMQIWWRTFPRDIPSGRKISEMKKKRRMTTNAGFGAESRNRTRRDSEGDCGYQRAIEEFANIVEAVSPFDDKMDR
jgi:hypothetical protein